MMIRKKSALDFEMFLSALHRSNQGHVVDLLRVHINGKFDAHRLHMVIGVGN